MHNLHIWSCAFGYSFVVVYLPKNKNQYPLIFHSFKIFINSFLLFCISYLVSNYFFFLFSYLIFLTVHHANMLSAHTLVETCKNFLFWLLKKEKKNRVRLSFSDTNLRTCVKEYTTKFTVASIRLLLLWKKASGLQRKVRFW